MTAHDIILWQFCSQIIRTQQRNSIIFQSESLIVAIRIFLIACRRGEQSRLHLLCSPRAKKEKKKKKAGCTWRQLEKIAQNSRDGEQFPVSCMLHWEWKGISQVSHADSKQCQQLGVITLGVITLAQKKRNSRTPCCFKQGARDPRSWKL